MIAASEPTELAPVTSSGSDLLSQFYASNPAYASEYNRVHDTLGDKRSATQWFTDFLAASPQDAQKFADFANPAPDYTGGIFSTPPEIANQAVDVPQTIADFLNPAPSPAESPNTGGDLLAQLNNLFTSFFASFSRPSTSVTVAPTTSTSITENVAVDNSQQFLDQSTHTTDNSITQSGWSYDQVIELVNRITGLPSVASGGNGVVSPSFPAVGYGQNVAQSAPRLGGQTIASVGGLELNTAGVGVGGFGIPWKTLIIGAILSVVAFILYRKFFK